MRGQARASTVPVHMGDGRIELVTRAIGLDYAAALAFAQAMGTGGTLFTEILPEIEWAVVSGFNRDAGLDSDESDE